MKKTLLKHLRLLCLTIAPLILVFNSSAQAQHLSQDDSNSIFNNTVWYQASGSFACSVAIDVTLNGNDRVEQAYNFFLSYFTAAQSAGIVGNFDWESSVDPTKVNGGAQSDTPLGDKAWGIAQWLGSRRTDLLNYAAQNHIPASALTTQLNFSLFEFNGKLNAALVDLKKQTTPEAAALSVFNKYEGANDSTGPKRQALAAQIRDKYGDGTGLVAAPSSLDDCSGSSGPGQNSQYIDGFTVYSQYDPQWANKLYGSSTIADSGCGPSAMAMIVTALTARNVTPDVAAAYAGQKNLYIPGTGSSWSIAPVLAARWGLKSQFIGANAARITAALQSGGLVIASGQGPLPFTTGGHYIVIRGVTADGKWKIGDSAHNDTSSQSWDPQQLITNMNDGSVYAITK